MSVPPTQPVVPTNRPVSTRQHPGQLCPGASVVFPSVDHVDSVSAPNAPENAEVDHWGDAAIGEAESADASDDQSAAISGDDAAGEGRPLEERLAHNPDFRELDKAGDLLSSLEFLLLFQAIPLAEDVTLPDDVPRWRSAFLPPDTSGSESLWLPGVLAPPLEVGPYHLH